MVDRDEREGSVERVVVGIVLGGALMAALRGMAQESALPPGGWAPARSASVPAVAAQIRLPVPHRRLVDQ